MFVEIDQAEVEAIKREVARFLPAVKSSHRAEAVARGLGFGSNAALREALASGARRFRTDGARFEEFLSKRGHLFRQDVRWTGTLSELEIAVLACWMRAILAKHPELNPNGMVLSRFGLWKTGYWSPRRKAEMLASPEGMEKLRESRLGLLDKVGLAEFAKCLEFLSRANRISRPHSRSTSYEQKHQVERWWDAERDAATGVHGYVPNGAYIAAAVHLGFPIRHETWDSPNCTVGVSVRSLNCLDPNTPKLPRVRGPVPEKDLALTAAWMEIFPAASVVRVPAQAAA
ncbi:hypothetical protein [Muricoccus radiodurans]|uniref:hypothetical protein n=1 Tax=Muricoccus radiodurans TaxID=2231721 RepID=UPI003CFB1EB3